MAYLISLVTNNKNIRETNNSKKFILLLARKVPNVSNKTIINTACFLYFFSFKKNNKPKIDSKENFCI